jgi:hypothetical protein
MPTNRETVTAYEADKKFIVKQAEALDVTQADIIADMVEEQADAQHRHRCPECDDTFTLNEVDQSTVAQQSKMEAAMLTDARYLVQDRNLPVKHFECPCCEKQVNPDEMDMNAQELDTDDSGNQG